MKNIITALVLGLGVVSAANAADGTINFTGKVSSVTCTINTVAPNGANNKLVDLPSIPVSSLSSVGQTAGTTAFQFTIGGEAGCSNAGGVALSFEAGPSVDTTTGALRNTATLTPATNVQVVLLNQDDSSPINIGSATPNNHATASLVAGTPAVLTYLAAYRATGAVVAGNVNASVTYSVVYP